MSNPSVSLSDFGFKKEGSWWTIALPNMPYDLSINLVDKRVEIGGHLHEGIIFDFEPMNFERIQNLYFALTNEHLKFHADSENS